MAPHVHTHLVSKLSSIDLFPKTPENPRLCEINLISTECCSSVPLVFVVCSVRLTCQAGFSASPSNILIYFQNAFRGLCRRQFFRDIHQRNTLTMKFVACLSLSLSLSLLHVEHPHGCAGICTSTWYVRTYV